MPKTVVALTHNRFPEIARRLPLAARRVVSETLYEIQGNARVDMAQSKSGRTYGDHQASAPGESPAIDTSNLVNSILVDESAGIVYTNAEYAEILEFGGINLLPRPFMTPAAEAERGSFMRKMADLESRL
jgi:phage gpG-like protein